MREIKNYIVYIVKNDINDKIYIGQTTETIEQRWNRHTQYQINNDDHFHRALRKYGPEHFHIEILDESATNQDELTELEIAHILSFSKNRLYNTKFSAGKCGGDTLSSHPNRDNICKKISESKKGGQNPHSNKVIAYTDSISIIFASFSECIEYFKKEKKFDLSRYSISRRCRGLVTNSLNINNELWNFKYKEK